MNKKNQGWFLTVITFVIAVLIPLANTFLLGPIRIAVGSDIAYPEIMTQLLSYIIEIISVACVFAYAACIACAFVHGIAKKAVTLICVLSIPFIYIASAAVDYLFYGGSAIGTSYFIYSLISCLFELLRLAAVSVVCFLVKRAGDKKGRDDTLELFSLNGKMSRAAVFTSATVFVSLLITKMTDTVMLLVEYGAPINKSETVYLIAPYVTVLVYSVLGYLLIYVISSMVLKRQTK